MTTQELETIKNKIEKLKKDKSKAEGAMENIEKDWKSSFGLNSLEEVQEKIEELEKGKEEIETKIKNLSEKIKDSYDWDLEDEL